MRRLIDIMWISFHISYLHLGSLGCLDYIGAIPGNGRPVIV